MHGSDSGLEPHTRKLLGFTDNRQDAALQAGHFNDFLFVSLIRAAFLGALEIAGDKGTSTVGTFRVDPTTLTVSPTELSLTRGQSQSLTFTLPAPAPTGGLLLDVTTDVPESVIMPEVVVPAGSSSLTVNVTGGKPGTGSLVLKGYGAGEVSIPVTVK